MDSFEAKCSLATWSYQAHQEHYVPLIHLAWRVGKCLHVIRQPLLCGLYARGPLLEQPWRRLPPLSRVSGHTWFSQQFQNKHRQMTLRIADLCLGTDKDWKVGKTKIFLKVRCWEALAASGLLGTAGGRRKSPRQPCLLWSLAGLWVPLAIGSCTGLPHSGHLGSKQKGGNRETG